jgi:hypothetical protein
VAYVLILYCVFGDIAQQKRGDFAARGHIYDVDFFAASALPLIFLIKSSRAGLNIAKKWCYNIFSTQR